MAVVDLPDSLPGARYRDYPSLNLLANRNRDLSTAPATLPISDCGGESASLLLAPPRRRTQAQAISARDHHIKTEGNFPRCLKPELAGFLECFQDMGGRRDSSIY